MYRYITIIVMFLLLLSVNIQARQMDQQGVPMLKQIGMEPQKQQLPTHESHLSGYLLIAANNNPALKAVFNEYMASLQQAPQEKALPDPQVAFAYFIEPVQTRVGPQKMKFSATQMFPWFGTRKAKENSALKKAESKYQLFKQTKSKLFHDVKSGYYNIYYNNRAIEIMRHNISILQSIKNLVESKLETSQSSAIDALRVEMQIGDMENQLALLIDKQYTLQIMFNKLINVDSNEDIITPEILWDDDIPMSRSKIMDSINNKNHQLLMISLQQEALSYKKKVATNMGKPGFSLGIDYTVIGKDANNIGGTDAIVFPRMAISIPLYRTKYKAMIKQVVYSQKSKELQKQSQINILETLLSNGWKDYRDGNRRIKLFKSQLKLAKQSLKLLETSYSTGVNDFEDVLNMEQKVLTYNLQLEKARADKLAAISFIHYLMGK